MRASIRKRMQQLNRQREKLLTAQPPALPMQDKIEQKVPVQVRQTLEAAFLKAFEAVFFQGDNLIRRTLQREKLEQQHRRCDELLEQQPGMWSVQRVGWNVHGARLSQQLGVLLEGSLLGLPGIGLPDILVFLSLLLRNVYGTAVRCGFDCDAPEERIYLLLLICCGASAGEERKAYRRRLEHAADSIWVQNMPHESVEQCVQEAAHVLALSMLAAKFVQGIPLVGVVGGPANLITLRSISRLACVEYQLRYLREKYGKES